MAIDLAALGLKLLKYREQLQETVDEVAKSTGIGAARLRDIEAGRQEPTGDEVLILADHYQCDFKYFISNDRVAAFEQTETLYRAHGREFDKHDRRAIQEFLYLCETEEFLMRELGRPRVEFSYSPTGSFFKRHGEEAAAALRAALGYDDRTVPRDVYDDFRKTGVHVFRRKLDNSRISGVFVKHPVAGRCALVNYSEDIYRQRFSAAHEMAHALFDASEATSASITLDGPTNDLVEVRANRFASCFLMPPAVLHRLPRPADWTGEQTLRWANEFRVSCMALAIALKEAKLIDEAAYERMRRLRVDRASKRDPELPESLSSVQRDRKALLLERGLSDFYVGLCFDALQQGVISAGRLAEALLTSQAELAELAGMYGRALNAH